MRKPVAPQDQVGRAALRKMNLRILPFLFIVMFAAFLDRTNLSYAAIGMKPELGLTASMFGFGAGILFLGEALFAVPSSMAARRVGVHLWIPVIMLFWGACATMMGAIRSPSTFYVLRFLLGAAESGVMPSILLAASLWWPEAYRARAITLITAGAGVAAVVGAPLGGIFADLHGLLGLSGWRWIFLAEGVPVIVMGAASFFLFSAGPKSASWLTSDEREWLLNALASDAEAANRGAANGPSSRGALPLISMAAVINFAVAGCAATLIFWLPQIGRELLGLSLKQIGSILGPVFVIGLFCAYFVSRYSDRAGQRYGVVMGCAAAGVSGMAVFVMLQASMAGFLALAVAFLLIRCIGGVFMAALSEDMRGAVAAPGFAVAMIAAGLGQFAANWAFGVLRDASQGFITGIGMLILLMLVTIAAAAYLQRRRARPTAVRASADEFAAAADICA